MIEQDRELLRLGERWAERVLRFTDAGSWEMRPFRRRIEMAKELLPRNAPEFNLWVMSFFLNELSESPDVIARKLFASWERHLEDEGLVILVEPALKLQSRRLLEIRKQLLEHFAGPRAKDFQILLPCLGHQACGALAAAEDWCHEEVAWWRPPYLKIIDEMAGLDRKTLPFSYLVITRSKRTREEILPALAEARGEAHRLVSPAHDEGRDLEFFMCGKDGKRRARYRAEKGSLSRGDILLGAEIQGAPEASRIKKISGCVP